MEGTQTQQTLTWQVTGMHCSSCSILIDESVEEIDGVASSSTSLKTKLTTVTFDSTRCEPVQITATIVEAGYTAALANETEPAPRRPWSRRTRA